MDYRDYEDMNIHQLAAIRQDVLDRLDMVTTALKKSARKEYETGSQIKKLARQAGVTRRTIYAWLSE